MKYCVFFEPFSVTDEQCIYKFLCQLSKDDSLILHKNLPEDESIIKDMAERLDLAVTLENKPYHSAEAYVHFNSTEFVIK